MSQAEPTPNSDLTCRDCGAVNDPGATECWLCQRRDWRGPPRFPMSPKPAPLSPTSGNASSLIGLTLGLVALGGIVIAPGLVIGLLIVVLPAWAGAAWIAHRRRNRGLPTSTTRKVVWIVVLSILLPILLGVALFIAFWLICLMTGPPTFR
jgi:ribosomal protein L40E